MMFNEKMRDGLALKERKRFECLENKEKRADDLEEEDRRLLEKKRWFDLMEGESGVNICESCPPIVEDRSDFVSNNSILKDMEVSADLHSFLDKYFEENTHDRRYKNLFFAYFDLSDDNVVDLASGMGLDMDRVDELIQNYLLIKIKKAARKSSILRG